MPASSKATNYVTPPVNNVKPVEVQVPDQKLDKSIVPASANTAQPLIGKPVQVNAELLKETKGKE